MSTWQDAYVVSVPARQLPAPAVLRCVAVPTDERAKTHLAVPRLRPTRTLRLARRGRVSHRLFRLYSILYPQFKEENS